MGYSGRDPSVMDAIRDPILQEDSKGKIFWCGFSDEPSREVAELLAGAAEMNRQAYFVPGVIFDDLVSIHGNNYP
jgi:hypothetical protein